jgi:hypothetical protein
VQGILGGRAGGAGEPMRLDRDWWAVLGQVLDHPEHRLVGGSGDLDAERLVEAHLLSDS